MIWLVGVTDGDCFVRQPEERVNSVLDSYLSLQMQLLVGSVGKANKKIQQFDGNQVVATQRHWRVFKQYLMFIATYAARTCA